MSASLLRAESIDLRLGLGLGSPLVLQGASIDLYPGELHGLIGANGSGKSSLVRVLSGLLSPTSGTVHWPGRPLRQWTRSARAQYLGYLPQGTECHWQLTVERLVRLGRLPYGTPSDRSEHPAIPEALAAMEISRLRQRPYHSLSGGEKIRVLFARILAGTPRVIIADEPLAGLDPFHQLKLLELLREWVRLHQRGVLLVLHDLTLASRFCHRLTLLHEGRVLASGSPASVCQEATLAQAFNIRVLSLNHSTEPFILPWARL
jgi:iron complex transport system ATP-binding protein